MTDRLPVLIGYSIRYNAQMGGRPKTKTVYEIVDMAVPSVSADDAPIAVRWDDMPEKWQEPVWGLFERNGDGHTRWYGDRHWTPVLGPGSYDVAGPADETTLDALSGLATSSQPFNPILGNVASATPANNNPKQRLDDCPQDLLSNVVGDSRARAIADVRTALRDLLVVGGVVYRSCPEPRVVLVSAEATTMTPAVRESIRVTTDEREIAGAMQKGLHKCAPVTGFDEMHDLCHLFGSALTSPANSRRRPEVLEQESLDEDDWFDQATKLEVGKFAGRYAGATISSLGPQQLMSMANIRVAIGIEDRADRLDALEGALADCVRHWRDYENRDVLEKLSEELSAREISVPFSDTHRGMKP